MDSKCIETVTQSRIDDIETPSMLSDWMHSQFYRVAIFKQLEGVGSMGSKKSELEPKKRNTVSFLVDAKDKKEVKKLHFQNIKYVSKSFENSVMIGEILDRIKKNSPHGTFTDIVKKDFSYMSIRSAQYYMKIFHNQDRLRKEMGENLSMREAIKYLSKPMDDTSEKEKKAIIKIIDDHTLKIREAEKVFRNYLRNKISELPERDREILLPVKNEKLEKLENRLSKINERKAKLENEIAILKNATPFRFSNEN